MKPEPCCGVTRWRCSSHHRWRIIRGSICIAPSSVNLNLQKTHFVETFCLCRKNTSAESFACTVKEKSPMSWQFHRRKQNDELAILNLHSYDNIFSINAKSLLLVRRCAKDALQRWTSNPWWLSKGWIFWRKSITEIVSQKQKAI